MRARAISAHTTFASTSNPFASTAPSSSCPVLEPIRSAMSTMRFMSRSTNASMLLYKPASGLSVSSRRGAEESAASKGFVCEGKDVNGAWGVRAVSGNA
jgi:hypothetical protein